MFILNRSLGG